MVLAALTRQRLVRGEIRAQRLSKRGRSSTRVPTADASFLSLATLARIPVTLEGRSEGCDQGREIPALATKRHFPGVM